MSASLGGTSRELVIPSEIGEVFEWISRIGFMFPARSSRSNDVGSPERPFDPSSPPVITSPTSRTQKYTKADLDRLLKEYREANQAQAPTQNELKRIWDEVRDPRSAVQSLDLARVSPDSIAFYRPFHFPPVEEWGIYLFVDRLLDYSNQLAIGLRPLRTFSPQSIALCVLFEVFHHEFFHHMVESTATALELIFASAGDPRPIYVPYRERVTTLEHDDTPIEEALANAYAYIAFSFIVKVGGGYGAGFSRIYQEALKKSWPKEPDGYRSAGKYIDGAMAKGSAMLLNLMLHGEPTGDTPTLPLATHLFPRGHTAMVSKPQIPTYLVGTPEQVDRFNELIPAPNEAYTSLLIANDTEALDTYIMNARAQERAAKKPPPAAPATEKAQPTPQQSLFE